MKKIIDLELNYFSAEGDDFNALMKKEFYAARDCLFGLGYHEYVEEKALPISPKDQNIFSPLATYRVKDQDGVIDWINIYARAFGSMLITNEF